MRILLVALLITTVFGYTIPTPTAYLNAFRGTEHEIVVRLETPSGTPVNNATLYLFHEVQNILLDTSLTNITGYATFLWQIPLSHDLGTTFLNATFLGEPERFLLPSYLSIPITIYSQMQMTIEIVDNNGYPIEATVHPNQNLVFIVFLKDDNSNPLAGFTVCFLNDEDDLFAEGVTSDNGSITFNYQVNSGLNSFVEFKVRSLNQGYFNACEEMLYFPVENSTTRFTNLPSFLQVNGQCFLAGYLRHQYGAGINGARIHLLLDGSSELTEGYTNQEGFFHFNLSQYQNQLGSGHFIVANFEGSDVYQSAQAIVGLVPTSTPTPFTQKVGLVSPVNLTILAFQLQIVTFSCLALGSTIAVVRIRRTTRNIVSH